MNYQREKFLVVGLGKSGLSMLHFLSEMGADVSAYDKYLSDEKRSQLAQAFPQVAFYSDSLADALRHDNFTTAALSPGVSAYLPELQAFSSRGGKLTGDVDLLCRLIHGGREKIIAITGSNGKSTVTELTGFLCRACGLDTVVAGNIGTPVLDAYHERGGNPADVWVLELSSFQLESVHNLCADAAACLNISEDHLDRYENLLDYAHAKAKIFRNARVQILNADDVLCCAMKSTDKNTQTRYFSLEKSADYMLKRLSGESLYRGDEKLVDVAALPLIGLHNAANVMAALALCEGIGLARAQLLEALSGFKGLPHRVERVGQKRGMVFIDDSKGTNVGATAAAIAGIQSPIWLIAGGLGKGQDFSPLAQASCDKVKCALLIGKDANAIEQAFVTHNIPTRFFTTLPDAVRYAYQHGQSGDVVLLSPACASMDMFRDYAHRSEVFIETFEELTE